MAQSMSCWKVFFAMLFMYRVLLKDNHTFDQTKFYCRKLCFLLLRRGRSHRRRRQRLALVRVAVDVYFLWVFIADLVVLFQPCWSAPLRLTVLWLGPAALASASWNCRNMLCRERPHRSRAPHERVSEMGLALNSLFGMEVLPAALGTSRAHEKARRVPHRSAVHLSIEIFSLTRSSCTTVGSPSEASAYFRLYGDGSSTAPYRAKLLVLPDSTVQYPCARFSAARGLRYFGGVQGEDNSEQRGAPRGRGLRGPCAGSHRSDSHAGKRLQALHWETDLIGSVGFFLVLVKECEVFSLSALISFSPTVQCVVVTDSFSRHKVYMTIGLLPVLTFGTCLVWDRPRPPRMSGFSLSLATLIGSTQCG